MEDEGEAEKSWDMGECTLPEGYEKFAIVGEWSLVVEEDEIEGVVRCEIGWVEDDGDDR